MKLVFRSWIMKIISLGSMSGVNRANGSKQHWEKNVGNQRKGKRFAG